MGMEALPEVPSNPQSLPSAHLSQFLGSKVLEGYGQKSNISLKPTKNTSVLSVFHLGRYIGKIVKEEKDLSFVVRTKEMIRKCNGFGVIPPIANCERVRYIIFIYQNRKYTLTRKKFLELGKTYQLGGIEKICVPISQFNCEDGRNDATLFD